MDSKKLSLPRMIKCHICWYYLDKNKLKARVLHMKDHALDKKQCPHCHVPLSSDDPNHGYVIYLKHVLGCNKKPKGFASEAKHLLETEVNDVMPETSSSFCTEEPKKKSSELWSAVQSSKVQLPTPRKRTASEAQLSVKTKLCKSGSISATSETKSNSGGKTPKKIKVANSKKLIEVNRSEAQNAARRISKVPSEDTQTEKSIFKCYLCEKPFKTTSELNFHMITIHTSSHSGQFLSSSGFLEPKCEDLKKHYNSVSRPESNEVFLTKYQGYKEFVSSKLLGSCFLQKSKENRESLTATNRQSVSADLSSLKASLDDDGMNFPEGLWAVVKEKARFKCIKCGKFFRTLKDLTGHVDSCKLNANCQAVNDEDISWMCIKCSRRIESDIEFKSYKHVCPRKKPQNANNFIKSGKKIVNKMAAPEIRDKKNLHKHASVTQPCKVLLRKFSLSDVQCKHCRSVFLTKNECMCHLKKCKLALRDNEVICTPEIPDAPTNLSGKITGPNSSGFEQEQGEVTCTSEIPDTRKRSTGEMTEPDSSENAGSEQEGNEVICTYEVPDTTKKTSGEMTEPDSSQNGEVIRTSKNPGTTKQRSGEVAEPDSSENAGSERDDDEVLCISETGDAVTDPSVPDSSNNAGPGHENSSRGASKSSLRFKCIPCKRVFRTQDGYENHVRKRHSSKTSACSYCKTSFSNPVAFHLHICNRMLNNNTTNSVYPSANAEASSSGEPEVCNDSESGDIKPTIDSWFSFHRSTNEENDEIADHGSICTKVEIEDTTSDDFNEGDISQNFRGPSNTSNMGSWLSNQPVGGWNDSGSNDIKPNLESLHNLGQSTSEEIGDTPSSDSSENCRPQNATQRSLGNSNLRGASAFSSKTSCVQRFPSSGHPNNQRCDGHLQRTSSQTSGRNQVSSACANSVPAMCNVQISNSHRQSNYVVYNRNPSGASNYPSSQRSEVINMAPQGHAYMCHNHVPNTSGYVNPQQTLNKNISSSFNSRNCHQNERSKCQNECNHSCQQYRVPYSSANFCGLNFQLPSPGTALPVRNPIYRINNSFHEFSVPPASVPVERPLRNSRTVRDFHEGRPLDSSTSSSSSVSESNDSHNSFTSATSDTPIISRCWSERPNKPVIPLQEVEIIFVPDYEHNDAYAEVNKTVDSQCIEKFICKYCIRSKFSKGNLIQHLNKEHNINIERELKVTEL